MNTNNVSELNRLVTTAIHYCNTSEKDALASVDQSIENLTRVNSTDAQYILLIAKKARAQALAADGWVAKRLALVSLAVWLGQVKLGWI